MCDKAGCQPNSGDIVSIFDFAHARLCSEHLKDLCEATLDLEQHVAYTRLQKEVEALIDLGQFPPDALWVNYRDAKKELWAWFKNWLNT